MMPMTQQQERRQLVSVIKYTSSRCAIKLTDSHSFQHTKRTIFSLFDISSFLGLLLSLCLLSVVVVCFSISFRGANLRVRHRGEAFFYGTKLLFVDPLADQYLLIGQL